MRKEQENQRESGDGDELEEPFSGVFFVCHPNFVKNIFRAAKQILDLYDYKHKKQDVESCQHDPDLHDSQTRFFEAFFAACDQIVFERRNSQAATYDYCDEDCKHYVHERIFKIEIEFEKPIYEFVENFVGGGEQRAKDKQQR